MTAKTLTASANKKGQYYLNKNNSIQGFVEFGIIVILNGATHLSGSNLECRQVPFKGIGFSRALSTKRGLLLADWLHTSIGTGGF